MTESVTQFSILIAEGGGGESPSAIDIPGADLVIVTIIVFIGLLLVLGKFAWKPIMTALDQREQGIADDIEAARQANEKAQTMLQQYEAKIEHAHEEANQLIAQAKADAATVRQKILDEANAEAQRQRERATAEIQAAKDEAARALAEKSVDSAVSLAGNLIGRELDRNSHQQLIEQSLQQFSNN